MLPLLKTSWPSIIDEFFVSNLPGFSNDVFSGTNTPAVNVFEDKDDYRIEVAAPGLEKNDFKINLENNVLTISSEKENRKEEKEGKYMRKEFSYASFCRSFSLPEKVEAEKISANHKDGVLYITIPKREEAKVKPARQIAIE